MNNRTDEKAPGATVELGHSDVASDVASAVQTPRIQSVARAIDLLLTIAASESGHTAPELSDALGLKRATTYHLLQTLEVVGVVNRDRHRVYRLGLRVATLVEAFGRQVAPPEHLLPAVRRLASETGETAYVAAGTDEGILLLGSVRGQHAVSVADSPIGLITDAHARAAGKLILAHMTSAARDAYLSVRKLERRTINTITTRAALESELSRIREDGYANDREEYAIGVRCLAVPLDEGASPYAISISAPSERFQANEERYREIALAIAASASRGHTGQ